MQKIARPPLSVYFVVRACVLRFESFYGNMKHFHEHIVMLALFNDQCLARSLACERCLLIFITVMLQEKGEKAKRPITWFVHPVLPINSH